MGRHRPGMGHGRRDGGVLHRPVQRRASEPRRNVRFRRDRRHGLGRRAQVPRRRVPWRVHRRVPGVGVLQQPLGRHGGPGNEAGRVLHGARDPQHRGQHRHGGRRHLPAGLRRAGDPRHPVDRRHRARAAAGGPIGPGNRIVAWRPDRVRDQPGPRPRAADRALPAADPGQGPVGLGLLLDPGGRAPRGRSARRAGVRLVVPRVVRRGERGEQS